MATIGESAEQIMLQQMGLIEKLAAADAIQFGEFELSHGGTSDYYIDKYLFETDPSSLDAIGDAINDHLKDIGEDDEKLAGVALGAVPLVSITSVKMKLPYLIVRKSKKEYGTGNRIEGQYDEGEEVIVLEDIATTGKSALDAAEALRESGLKVEHVVVVVDRQEGAEELLADHDITLHSLLTADALLNFGNKRGKAGAEVNAD